MPDTSKLEKLNRELEKSEKKLRKAINDEKALQHQLKQLTRKERTHRLCTRGGMLMVDFQNRKREFGLLEAVGVTRQQLKAMLDREIGIYLGGSLVIALVFGSILSVIVCRRLDAVNHCITLVLPWLFLLALVVVLAIIYLIFTVYAKSELKKTSILSAIREE